MSKNDGGPVFRNWMDKGMSVRVYLTTIAWRDYWASDTYTFRECVEQAVKTADAILAELEREK